MMPRTETRQWIGMARPLLARLGNRWTDEAKALDGLTFPTMALHAAVHLNAVERRRHWLTRKPQLRRSVPAYDLPRLGLAS